MLYIEGLKDYKTLYRWREHTRSNQNVKGGAGIALHIQPSVEIIYVTDGKIDIEVDGVTETAHTGEAALIFPFQPHQYIRYRGSEFIRFDFDVSLAQDFFSSDSGAVGKSSVFKASAASDFILRSSFVGKAEVSKFTVQSFLYSILSDFTSQIETVKKKENGGILVETIYYVRSNKERVISLESVAKELGYSAGYLSFAINKTVGFGFNTLVAMIRVENAKQLLHNTKKTMLEIVLECGFGSERSFYRQFKQITGISPLKYRKEQP